MSKLQRHSDLVIVAVKASDLGRLARVTIREGIQVVAAIHNNFNADLTDVGPDDYVTIASVACDLNIPEVKESVPEKKPSWQQQNRGKLSKKARRSYGSMHKAGYSRR